MNEDDGESEGNSPLVISDWVSLIQNDISILYSMKFTFISVFTAVLLVLPTVVYFKIPDIAIFNQSVGQTQLLFLTIYLVFIILILILARNAATVITGDLDKKRACYEILLGKIIIGEILDTNVIAIQYLEIRKLLNEEKCKDELKDI